MVRGVYKKLLGCENALGWMGSGVTGIQHLVKAPYLGI